MVQYSNRARLPRRTSTVRIRTAANVFIQLFITPDDCISDIQPDDIRIDDGYHLNV